MGDPIEALALDAVLGRGRGADAPLLIGSVKANIGHLEAAAGVAGVIKLALALQRGAIPPQIHFDTPNPHIPWDELRLCVPRQQAAWPDAGKPRFGGVSSFGFSGTNAHIILEAPAPAPRPSASARPLHIMTASARSEEALDSLATGYASTLLTPGVALEAAAYTANAGRAQLGRRIAVVAGSSDRSGRTLRLSRTRRDCGARTPWRGAGEGAKSCFPFYGPGRPVRRNGKGSLRNRSLYFATPSTDAMRICGRCGRIGCSTYSTRTTTLRTHAFTIRPIRSRLSLPSNTRLLNCGVPGVCGPLQSRGTVLANMSPHASRE